MKERPILFSAPMVRAILAGTKTQTRRAVKPEGAHHLFPFLDLPGNPTGEWAWCSSSHVVSKHIRCPYGQPGDRLWVREAWAETDREDGTPVIAYRAGGNIAIGRDHPKGNDYLIDTIAWDDMPHVETWRPSIHMPRWASRILLEITAVRIERLQDISDNDIEAEGTAQWVKDGGKVMRPRPGFDGWWWPDENGNVYVKPNRVAFCSLWESVNGLFAWYKNPWVWVIEFKRVEGGAS